MNLYEAIEDEFCKALEDGLKPPREFSVTFEENEFLALLNSVVDGNTGQRYPADTPFIPLRLCGYSISVWRQVVAT